MKSISELLDGVNKPVNEAVPGMSASLANVLAVQAKTLGKLLNKATKHADQVGTFKIHVIRNNPEGTKVFKEAREKAKEIQQTLRNLNTIWNNSLL